MNDVVDQGDCGSCWAFASTATIEGMYSITYGSKLKLSEQQMVDCSIDNLGCEGGWEDEALLYIRKAGGQMKQSDYKYDGV